MGRVHETHVDLFQGIHRGTTPRLSWTPTAVRSSSQCSPMTSSRSGTSPRPPMIRPSSCARVTTSTERAAPTTISCRLVYEQKNAVKPLIDKHLLNPLFVVVNWRCLTVQVWISGNFYFGTSKCGRTEHELQLAVPLFCYFWVWILKPFKFFYKVPMLKFHA